MPNIAQPIHETSDTTSPVATALLQRLIERKDVLAEDAPIIRELKDDKNAKSARNRLPISGIPMAC